ncbi:hypothetical protein CYCD_20750 [Tenuifilaceae bacterium CYCD]|nr:hypothetical protein CYCD_20750 [Tenuifilaceae bacterium CYCD]
MKKLKDLMDVEKINVPELMKLKGGVAELEKEEAGCFTHACASSIESVCTNMACIVQARATFGV